MRGFGLFVVIIRGKKIIYQVLLWDCLTSANISQEDWSSSKVGAGQDSLQQTKGQGAASATYPDQSMHSRLRNGIFPVVLSKD